MTERDDKPENVFLKIHPDELLFTPNFEKAVPLTLTVKNTNPSAPVAFKVRTTAPKRYMVKPGTGAIPIGGSAEVTVFLTLNKEPMKISELRSLKDKFQIQELDIPTLPEGTEEQKAETLKILWSSPPPGVRSQKLRCGFNLPAEETPSSPDGATSASFAASTPSVSPMSGSTSVEDEKASRYRAERDKFKREYERVLKEKATLEKQAEAAGGHHGIVPILVAFVLGFILAKII